MRIIATCKPVERDGKRLYKATGFRWADGEPATKADFIAALTENPYSESEPNYIRDPSGAVIAVEMSAEGTPMLEAMQNALSLLESLGYASGDIHDGLAAAVAGLRAYIAGEESYVVVAPMPEAMQNALSLLESLGYRDGDVHDDLAAAVAGLRAIIAGKEPAIVSDLAPEDRGSNGK